MASNQTSNFALSQWSAEDKVLREEFNADNAKIDAALLAARTAPCCVTGKYKGGVEGGITVDLGFKPSFLVIIRGSNPTENNAVSAVMGNANSMLQIRYNTSTALGGATITDNGFSVTHTPTNANGLNYANITYHYTAFY